MIKKVIYVENESQDLIIGKDTAVFFPYGDFSAKDIISSYAPLSSFSIQKRRNFLDGADLRAYAHLRNEFKNANFAYLSHAVSYYSKFSAHGYFYELSESDLTKVVDAFNNSPFEKKGFNHFDKYYEGCFFHKLTSKDFKQKFYK